MPSKILQPNGDDHPEAAGKHLNDAQTLESQSRHDGAGYLAGYVVECCLKAVVLVEYGAPTWDGRTGHDLRFLSANALRFASIASAKTAKYAPFGNAGHPIYDPNVGWRHTLRYREQGAVPVATAQTWIAEANFVFQKTVAPMRLDGVI